MAQIVIQEYTTGYKEAVLAHILAIQQQEFAIPISRADQPDLEDIPGFYQRGNGNFWLALADGQVVGTVGLIDIGAGQGVIRKMFVHKAYRGDKAAGLLLRALLDWARQHGLDRLLLGTTEQFTAAHRFYEKNGFRPVAKADLPAAFPVMKVDTRFYQYRLTT